MHQNAACLPDPQHQTDDLTELYCVAHRTRLTEVLCVLSEEENAILLYHTAQAQQAYQSLILEKDMKDEEVLALCSRLSPAELEFVLFAFAKLIHSVPHEETPLPVLVVGNSGRIIYYSTKRHLFKVLSDVDAFDKNEWGLS